MRVFIAFELERSVREQLSAIQNQLRPYVQKGNFSRPENFHITVRFLGERTPREIDAIVHCMQRVALSASSFSLESCGLDCFHKKRDICYADVQDKPELLSLYRALQDELWSQRLISQKESYTPHITLAREVVWREPFLQLLKKLRMPSIAIDITGLSLMESTRVDGRLCYLPLTYQGFSERGDKQ